MDLVQRLDLVEKVLLGSKFDFDYNLISLIDEVQSSDINCIWTSVYDLFTNFGFRYCKENLNQASSSRCLLCN